MQKQGVNSALNTAFFNHVKGEVAENGYRLPIRAIKPLLSVLFWVEKRGITSLKWWISQAARGRHNQIQSQY
jgi:hypothetical protein